MYLLNEFNAIENGVFLPLKDNWLYNIGNLSLKTKFLKVDVSIVIYQLLHLIFMQFHAFKNALFQKIPQNQQQYQIYA